MTEAIFGLVGVVVGGVLTGVVGLYAERHRERRQARIAARILREHLLEVMRAGEDVVAGRAADLPGATSTLLEVWAQERRALATVMDYRTYAEVLAGVQAAGPAVAAHAAGPDATDRLMTYVGRVGAAAHEIKPLAGGR